MSVDTSHARPTSPPSDASTPSAWDAMRLQIAAEWAVKAAAERAEFGPARPLTADELRSWLAKYDDWLKAPYVQNHGALRAWVGRQKAAAEAQLATLATRSAR